MRKLEKELFTAVCSFKAQDFDERLIKTATPILLGQLFYNRMQAVAYGVLEKHNLLGKINREFRNSLKASYEHNVGQNKNFFESIYLVEEALSKCNCNYAMLKGAYLCKAYPEGYRTSNDIDLLVHPGNVSEIGNALVAAGFKQGSVRDGYFVPATRKEIITSKMMRGETVPYIKEICLSGMRFLEVDINFSLDYRPGDTCLLENMLENTSVREVGNLKVRTLRSDDFFIHLCSHLYKEATTLPWIKMMRDMTLYKYADIYMLLSDMSERETERLFERARATDTSKICAFAIVQMSHLLNFTNRCAVEKANEILKPDPDFIHTVISPADKKVYVFTEKNIQKRFFASDRKRFLKEVTEG